MKDMGKVITSKDSNCIDRYFRDIQEYGVLDANEEIELANRVQQGDPRALDRLVLHNTRFVISVAKKYQGRGTPLSDLISEGNLGLIEAAKRFNPDMGMRFTTYAVWWIKKGILATVDGEIKNSHTSIDAPMGNGEDEDWNLASRLKGDGPSTDHLAEKHSTKKEVEMLLSHLKEREQEIIKSLFGIETRAIGIEEAGKRFGLTQQRIGQIRDAVILQLQEKVRS